MTLWSNFIKKETLAQLFSCEIREIFRNTYFYRTSPVDASVNITYLTGNNIIEPETGHSFREF